MDKVFVVWKSYHKPEIIERGYWDQGLLEDIFKQGDFDYQHITDTGDVPGDQGAIFIINGRTHIEDTDKINADIANLRWVLFIDTGDEEANFPWREVKHPLMRVWMMLPRMNVHDDTHLKLPNGYRPNTRELLKDIGQQERSLDWFFAGQVNHERREQCVHELHYLVDSGEVPKGRIVPTHGFGQEVLAYRDYLTLMASSKIVLCPSGVESPDNFRLYEALEAGCLPIVDAFSPTNKHPGFWQYLFGNGIPFPIVEYWDELPKLMPELLRGWPHNANKAFAWWQNKKRELRYSLIDDVRELSR